jgi:hypothetical protein
MLRVLAKHALAGAFDDNEVRILVEAFEQAWKALLDSGAPFASEGQKNATRELLALRIIEIAQLGERDRNAFATTPSRTSPVSPRGLSRHPASISGWD